MTAQLGGTHLARVALGLLVGVLITLYGAGLVAGLAIGPEAASIVLIGWSPEAVSTVTTSWGLPAGSVSAYLLLLDLALFALGAVAAWTLLRRPWQPFRAYIGLVVLLHVTVGGSSPLLLAAAVPALSWVVALSGLGWFGLFTLLLIFPDGRFVPRWTSWTIPAWLAVFVWFLTTGPTRSPPPAAAVTLLGLLLIGLVAQIHRYRTVSDPITRQQTRGVFALLLARVGFVVLTGLARLAYPTAIPTAPALVIELAGMGVSYLISALLMLSIAVAVVRHRIFDTEVVISRAVVYAALTGFVLLVYGVVVGVVGVLWPGGGLVLPVLATATAAAGLVPVQGWVRRRAARLVYGDRAEPYRITRELGDRLAATGRPEDLVETVVEVVGEALQLRRVAIELDGRSEPLAVHTSVPHGSPAGDAESFPIEHQGRRVGWLQVTAERSHPLIASDRELLAGLAAQAGLAVAAVQTLAELDAARAAAVAVREEERRRMHRDLHDGLGPTLAGIYQRVELAGRLIPTDPATSRQLLDETGTQVRDTVADVRRLVYALRPPRLDDLGLVEALRATCADLAPTGLPSITVTCDEPLPVLPAAVEITAYRIVSEAVTNCVRHADARRCQVELGVTGSALTLAVRDDGHGLPANAVSGAGSRSLRERAAEVGGCVEITSSESSGTVVAARLPLSGTDRR